MLENICLFVDNLPNYLSLLNAKAMEYEKLVIVFSGIATAFTAIVAILISLWNSRKQKEIQLRQIKLESYELRYKCWYALLQIEFLLETEQKNLSGFELGVTFELKQYDALIERVKEFLNFSCIFNEIKFFTPIRDYNFINKLQEDLKEVMKHFFTRKARDMNNLLIINNCLPKVKKIRENLEKDLYLADIHKIR